MKCPNCNTINKSDACFCENCGKKFKSTTLDFLNHEYTRLKNHNTETQKKLKAWIAVTAGIFIFAIIAVAFAIYFYSKFESRGDRISNLESENYNIKNENNNKTSENQATINSLRNTIEQQKSRINSLEAKLPQEYRTIRQAKLYYKDCYSNYIDFNCVYSKGGVSNIYEIERGYGLTLDGWVKMSDLEKY